MYLCFVDESGTHGSSPVLVVGGIVIHEEDVTRGFERPNLGRSGTSLDLASRALRLSPLSESRRRAPPVESGLAGRHQGSLAGLLA